jgi:hypothetical protein
LDDRSKSKVKCIVVLNALGVALSSLISWVLIEWTKAALLKSQQGLLPLPAITNAVFKLQPALIAPVTIFLLISVLSVRSGNQGKGRTVLVISLALVTIIATSSLVSAACLLPWFPRHP